tara:strand:- start:275 stop:547 length:273 start_codon:yes stop_codon:yes gene_type:complete
LVPRVVLVDQVVIKEEQVVILLRVFHLTLLQFVVVEVVEVDLQEQLQELMVDQVVVDPQQVEGHPLLILEQVFVDKEILVEVVLMQRLLL